MVDWRSSMQQTYEYFIVDPNTWKDMRQIRSIKSCKITRDGSAETLGSANITTTESLGECYVRVYLVTVQNGMTERHPLGTFLTQTPSSKFTGRVHDITIDAYTPLLELKENPPPLGYSLLKGTNIMEMAHRLCREHARAPVVETSCNTTLTHDFVAETDDTWVTYIGDLIANAKYSLSLDELGRILFSPNQNLSSLQPVWTYDDSNSSILYPDIELANDLYGIPNVVEVIYSNGVDSAQHVRVVNDDPNSPISTVSRGREIKYRVTEPGFVAEPTAKQIREYAEQLLRELSTVECTVTYTHGYCGTRLGDCIRLNYSRAGLVDIKAKIINQTIDCTKGCPVTEKAVFNTTLWR